MASINIPELITDIKEAVKMVVDHDLSTIHGFAEGQLEAIAQQTEFVTNGINSGQITEATRGFFLQSLKDMAHNFARTLSDLITITIEKVWNAVINVLWRAIGRVTNLILPTNLV